MARSADDRRRRDRWTLREIGGRAIAGYSGCAKCHADTGLADPLESVRSSRGAEWVAGHVIDPEMIAPGLARTAGGAERA